MTILLMILAAAFGGMLGYIHGLEHGLTFHCPCHVDEEEEIEDEEGVAPLDAD